MAVNESHKKRCAINTKSSLANCTCGFTARWRKKKINNLRAENKAMRDRIEELEASGVEYENEMAEQALVISSLQAANTLLRGALEKITCGEIRKLPLTNEDPILGIKVDYTPEMAYDQGFEMATLECGEIAAIALKQKGNSNGK